MISGGNRSELMRSNRSSRPEVFYKKGVLTNS